MRTRRLGLACAGSISVATFLTSPAFALTGQSNFTPQSLKVPVWSILLQSASGSGSGGAHCEMPSGGMSVDLDGGASFDSGTTDGGSTDGSGAAVGPMECERTSGPQTLYQCHGATEADCLVDFADNEALARLFTRIDVNPGTYDQITVGTCDPTAAGSRPHTDNEPNYHAYLRGSVTLAGTTYYTKGQRAGTGDPLTTILSEQSEVSVGFSGCGSSFPLFAPVTVHGGDTLDVSGFFSLTDIAWGALGPSELPSGCVSNHTAFGVGPGDDGSLSVCMSYPNLAPYIGAAAPSLERYLISEDPGGPSTAGGQLLLIVSPDGRPIGGFTRRYYAETSVRPSANYDTPVKSIHDNGDGTFDVKNWGGWIGSDGHGGCGVRTPEGQCAISDFYLDFPAFRRDAMSAGTFINGQDAPQSSHPYHSVLTHSP